MNHLNKKLIIFLLVPVYTIAPVFVRTAEAQLGLIRAGALVKGYVSRGRSETQKAPTQKKVLPTEEDKKRINNIEKADKALSEAHVPVPCTDLINKVISYYEPVNTINFEQKDNEFTVQLVNADKHVSSLSIQSTDRKPSEPVLPVMNIGLRSTRSSKQYAQKNFTSKLEKNNDSTYTYTIDLSDSSNYHPEVSSVNRIQFGVHWDGAIDSSPKCLIDSFGVQPPHEDQSKDQILSYQFNAQECQTAIQAEKELLERLEKNPYTPKEKSFNEEMSSENKHIINLLSQFDGGKKVLEKITAIPPTRYFKGHIVGRVVDSCIELASYFNTQAKSNTDQPASLPKASELNEKGTQKAN